MRHLYTLLFLAIASQLVVRVLLRRRQPQPYIKITGGDILKTIRNDHPDVQGNITPVTGRDAENESVALTEELTTDNETAVSFVYDEDSSSTNPRGFTRHTGSSGVANINYIVRDARGNIVKSVGEQITVVTGDVIAVEGGEANFGEFQEV